ncbi:hypothetical protein NDU88_002799 [Pleurodeles waltl]|uniref:Uncharacterized protein n=1 Tax=Pleurodeles waltl TaxID=8319 RepID=A0AAV7NHF2_PLEWA|nr:hypothetical protein NDU88_002799 [Pleurodeles waltl]
MMGVISPVRNGNARRQERKKTEGWHRRRLRKANQKKTEGRRCCVRSAEAQQKRGREAPHKRIAARKYQYFPTDSLNGPYRGCWRPKRASKTTLLAVLVPAHRLGQVARWPSAVAVRIGQVLHRKPGKSLGEPEKLVSASGKKVEFAVAACSGAPSIKEKDNRMKPIWRKIERKSEVIYHESLETTARTVFGLSASSDLHL